MAARSYTQFPFRAELLENANEGAQRRLVLAETPAGAMEALIGLYLDEAGALTVVGDYYVVAPIGGLANVTLNLTATIAASTATTAGSKSLYAIKTADGNAKPSALLTAYGYQAITGVGALVTATLQADTLTSKGEKYAVIKITLGAAPNVTFTQADMNGVRQ